METVKSRSESPFSKVKTKIQVSDAPENGDAAPEPVKPKKKRYGKQRLNGKENGESEKNGNDFHEQEKVVAQQIENNEENGNVENDTCNNGYEVNKQVKEESEENDALISAYVPLEESFTVNESNSNGQGGLPQSEEPQISNMTFETESSAKRHTNEHDLLPEQEANVEGNGEVNEGCSVENEENAEEFVPTETPSQIGLNGSDSEEANASKDHIQASPDTCVKDDGSFSNKITNFLGKWNYSSSQEEKEDPEISSSRKLNESVSSEGGLLAHPYLSKVSGRRGIKDRLSSTFTGTQDEEMRTPTHSSNPLNDSFRVRTNPPQLNSSKIQENPTLRKYKGKRCLNAAEDDPEDEGGLCSNTIKRQKLDEAHETGLLGSILWSPFKKKSLEREKPTAESKLSRFLSPFWFWKKTSAGDDRK